MAEIDESARYTDILHYINGRHFWNDCGTSQTVLASPCFFRTIHRCTTLTINHTVKVKVEVYSLVSSATRYSPDFTQLPSGPRTRSFISHLKSPGSIQPGCHFRSTKLLKHTSLHCPTRYPLTPGSRDCTCGQSALPRSTTSEHNSAQSGIEPAIFRL